MFLSTPTLGGGVSFCSNFWLGGRRFEQCTGPGTSGLSRQQCTCVGEIGVLSCSFWTGHEECLLRLVVSRCFVRNIVLVCLLPFSVYAIAATQRCHMRASSYNNHALKPIHGPEHFTYDTNLQTASLPLAHPCGTKCSPYKVSAVRATTTRSWSSNVQQEMTTGSPVQIQELAYQAREQRSNLAVGVPEHEYVYCTG